MAEKTATIKDIAQELGVSTSTVSRILNGKNQSNAQLVKQVRRISKRLNYQVNTAALGLRTNKTRLLGIIVPEISDDFFAAILSGIEEVTEELGYNLLICQSNESREKEQRLVKSLLACNVEGLLMSISRETRDAGFLQPFVAAGKEVVFFDRVPEQDHFLSIPFDDFSGTYKAGLHLISTGCSRMLYLGFSNLLSNDKERLSGYNTALSEQGLEPCDVAYVGEKKATKEVLARVWESDRYDAVVCYNDVIAAEVLDFFRRGGMSVPDEVSVLGFDNRSFCQYTSPALSSIEHSTQLMGQQAARTILGLLNKTAVEQVPLEAGLVLRQSTKPTL